MPLLKLDIQGRKQDIPLSNVSRAVEEVMLEVIQAGAGWAAGVFCNVHPGKLGVCWEMASYKVV